LLWQCVRSVEKRCWERRLHERKVVRACGRDKNRRKECTGSSFDTLREVLRRRQSRRNEFAATLDSLRHLRTQQDALGRRDGVVDTGKLESVLFESGDEVLKNGRRAVVENGGRAKGLDEVEVGGRGGGDDLQARGEGELDGSRADGRSASPNEDNLALAINIGSLGLGEREVEERRLVETVGGGRECEGEDGGFLEGHGGGERRDGDGGENRVELEGAFRRLLCDEGLRVSGRNRSDCSGRRGKKGKNIPKNAVTLLDGAHPGTYSFDHSRSRLSEDGRELDEKAIIPADRKGEGQKRVREEKKEGNDALNLPVDGVDRDGVDLQRESSSRVYSRAREKNAP
jgi:hypothetical protein